MLKKLVLNKKKKRIESQREKLNKVRKKNEWAKTFAKSLEYNLKNKKKRQKKKKATKISTYKINFS